MVQTIQMKQDKALHALKLHEALLTGPYYVTRVPNGWIYESAKYGSIVFVPWSAEFSKGDER